VDEPAVRVLLADPHAMFTGGLRDLLAYVGVDVVGEATNEKGAVALAVELEPDVVVVDVGAPGMSGAETVRRLRAAAPASAILVLTDSAEAADVLGAVAAGVSGYVLKDASFHALVASIRATATAPSLVLPRMVAELLAEVPVQPLGRDVLLSGREVDVLRLIAEGHDNGEIAAALFISESTAKSHVSHILKKLNTQNRVQAAVYAVRAGIV